jgi:hypothetical protein
MQPLPGGLLRHLDGQRKVKLNGIPLHRLLPRRGKRVQTVER